MNIGDEFTYREHRTAPRRRFRIDAIHEHGAISATNTADESANRKGGALPRTYLTPTNLEGYAKMGMIEWHTEAR